MPGEHRSIRSLFRSARYRIAEFSLDIGVSLLAVALLWAGLGFAIVQQRHSAYHEAVKDNRTLAFAFEENIVRTFDAIDQTLQFMQSVTSRGTDLPDIRQWVRSEHFSDWLIVQARILDSSGALASTMLGPVDQALPFADRDYFQFHLNASADALFIGKPVLGRKTGKWLVHLSRRLTRADGSFAGVVVVSIDPYALSQFYEKLSDGGSSMSLVGTDGFVRARVPLADSAIGESVKDGPLFTAIAHGEQGDLAGISKIDNSNRLYSFRVLAKYGMIVVVGQKIDDIFGAQRKSIYAYIGGGSIVTLIIIGIFLLIVRKKSQLIRSRQLMTDLLDNISQGIIMVDSKGRVPFISRSMRRLLGVPQELMSGGRRFDDIVKWQVASGEFGSGENTQTGFRSFIESGGTDGLAVYERQRPNGTVIEIRTNLLPSGGAVRTYTDVTERKRSEAKIVYLALHDPLTGLANRTTFHQAVNEAIGSASVEERSLAVVFLDLDRFKIINDLHGHAVGDLLLRGVADRLRQIVRASDVVARLGGDEFAILQKNIRQPRAAMRLATRVVDLLREPFYIDGKFLSIGVSIGVAPHLVSGRTPERLMKDADVALYCAKESGRSQARLFDPSMDLVLEETRIMETELRVALSEGQFAIYYQPIMDIGRDRLVGFEALLRWLHPTRGTVPPAVFVPIAEKIGLISEIGEWVIRRASADATLWPLDTGLNVNVSPIQFRDDGFPERVFALVKQAGLDPRRLTLEMTETILIEDGARVSGMIDKLRAIGFRVVLDDFGAGHSSLSYLRRFAFDGLKIDRSFIDGIERDRSTAAIISHLLKLGADLNIEVTAEGVETAGQLRVLRQLDCRIIQGFFFGQPLPIGESVRLITQAV
jgi:diguanylate cyclase (GGDEF)-like protein